MTRTLSFLALALITSACAEPMTDAGEAPEAADALDGELNLVTTSADDRMILFVANTASFEELDVDAALDVRAARNIVDARPFDTLAELDDVSYVGDSALGKLRDYAYANPVDVYGIQEGSLLAEAILEVANTASQTELDDDVPLDSRAAANIVNDRAAQPFYSLGELDDVSYVAGTAMAALADYVDADGDGIPTAHDCDDSDATLLFPGESAACPVASCAVALALNPAAEDGSYILEDTDGTTFGVTCDMTTDGGGWTLVTGELLDDRDWVAFSIEDGPASINAGGTWTETAGQFYLLPENTDFAAGSYSCDGVAVRATATLPFTFSEWSGTFVGDELDSFDHADDYLTDTAWGEARNDCGGHFKFGTDQDDSKSGGEWGWNWAPRTWTFAEADVNETDVIRWETMDSYGHEGVLVHSISIKVR